ncbi:transglutaminase-like domain-containing protein [Paenibacillus hamazuiensis]|uniref:transglutaminase-like domain-containing protein n=1 Tax=Paenibacillus hamazuiensis TaxID=2936508 RepID=UPI00200DE034|nr:transglutaminase-like domain-containing protein [Paenibacillus hamazuiensis]
MLSRALVTVLSALFLLIAAPQGIEAASAVIDKSSLGQGIITVNYPDNKDAKAIVRIAKGSVKYDYALVKGGRYPLQLGNGSYSVLIAEAAEGSKYKVIAQESLDLKLDNENAVFLQSIPMIDWKPESKPVVEAKALTAGGGSDKDKVAAIYAYITKHFTYDYEKASGVDAGYLPQLDEIYDASKGICYDFAATFAAMARSVDIPTRLVMGYANEAPDTYHAWNQVFLKESGEWITIDTTYDAVRLQNGQETPLVKDAKDYTVSKIY